jgi:hypothetical protein
MKYYWFTHKESGWIISEINNYQKINHVLGLNRVPYEVLYFINFFLVFNILACR